MGKGVYRSGTLLTDCTCTLIILTNTISIVPDSMKGWDLSSVSMSPSCVAILAPYCSIRTSFSCSSTQLSSSESSRSLFRGSLWFLQLVNIRNIILQKQKLDRQENNSWKSTSMVYKYTSGNCICHALGISDRDFLTHDFTIWLLASRRHHWISLDVL